MQNIYQYAAASTYEPADWDDLWNQAKHKAVIYGLSLRDLLLKALREYLK